MALHAIAHPPFLSYGLTQEKTFGHSYYYWERIMVPICQDLGNLVDHRLPNLDAIVPMFEPSNIGIQI